MEGLLAQYYEKLTVRPVIEVQNRGNQIHVTITVSKPDFITIETVKITMESLCKSYEIDECNVFIRGQSLSGSYTIKQLNRKVFNIDDDEYSEYNETRNRIFVKTEHHNFFKVEIMMFK